MEVRNQFEKQYRRLFTEAVLRSLVLGLVFGFGLAFLCAMALWIFDVNGWWMSFIGLAVGTLVAAAILYFKKYHPTLVDSARRIDRLGLQERLITMVEYQNDDSFMAAYQREDAMQKLREVDPASIKLKVSISVIVALIISGILGTGMITVAGLSEAGLLPNFDDFVETVTPAQREVWHEVTYIIEDGGYIEGEADQLVLDGKDAESVVAVADEGYVFVGWDDGGKKPARTDRQITESQIFTAIFVPIDEDGEGAGMPGMDGPPQDSPDSNSTGSGETSTEGEDANGNTGGGKYEEANQVIDGKVYYREILGMYRDELIAYLEESGDTLSDEERAIIEYYIQIV